jgi:hypothetical protein
VILYDPKIHETLLVAWHYSLQADPVEHGQLFMEPLRNLTNLLGWAKDQVKLLISWDAKGLTAAVWIEPMMAGAFLGAWLRKDYRDIRGLAFIRQAHDKALEHFEPLIAVTKRSELSPILLKLGYEYVGEIPGLFDGNRVRVYYMLKETRYGSGRRKDIERNIEQPLRAPAGELRHVSSTAIQVAHGTNGGSPANGRSERPDTHHQPKRRRGKVGAKSVHQDHARSTRAQRPVG